MCSRRLSSFEVVLNSSRARRQRIAPDVNSFARDGIDRSADPQLIFALLDLKVICAAIHTVPLKAARYAGTPIRATLTIRIGRGAPIDEAREHAMDDRLSVLVRAWLEACVTHVRVTYKTELLGKVVARDVVCLDDGEGEGDVCKSSGGYICYRPG